MTQDTIIYKGKRIPLEEYKMMVRPGNAFKIPDEDIDYYFELQFLNQSFVKSEIK